MKRPSSLDSVSAGGGGGMISLNLCDPAEEKMVYGGAAGSFQSILDGFEEEGDDQLGDAEDVYTQSLTGRGGSSGEKKRRLGVEQVKALEKSFEVENKLEPDRKVKLAQELGLQPRQVAVWFQNRRARWKTKQLERDYGILKTDYDAIKMSCDNLRHEKEALLAEIKELKAKLAGDGGESYGSIVKDEPLALEEEEIEDKSSIKGKEIAGAQGDETEPPALLYKDGSSDSDSSAILNDEISSNHLGGERNLSTHHHYNLDEEEAPILMGLNPFQCEDERGSGKFSFYCYQQHLRAEERSFFGEEEPCSSGLFSDEQPSEMPWFCSEQWG